MPLIDPTPFRELPTKIRNNVARQPRHRTVETGLIDFLFRPPTVFHHIDYVSLSQSGVFPSATFLLVSSKKLYLNRLTGVCLDSEIYFEYIFLLPDAEAYKYIAEFWKGDIRETLYLHFYCAMH